MLRDSIDALVNRDASLAHSVCARDDEVDRMKHDIRRQAERSMVAEPARLRALLTLLAASRSPNASPITPRTSPRT